MRATLLYQQYRLTLQSGEYIEGLGTGVIRTEHNPLPPYTLSMGAWLPGEGLHQQGRVSQRILPKLV